MSKGQPEASGEAQEVDQPDENVEVAVLEGTLQWKMPDRLGVLCQALCLYWLEYKPGSVYARWREGMSVLVYHTDDFRTQVVAMEEIESTAEVDGEQD